MTEVSHEFLAAVEQIIAHVEPNCDGTLCDSVNLIRQVLRAKAKRAAEVKQFLTERKEAGVRLDPATAEVSCEYGEILDPYGVWGRDLSPEGHCSGWQYFARAPGSDVWVSFQDLSEGTSKALRARMESGEFHPREYTRNYDFPQPSSAERRCLFEHLRSPTGIAVMPVAHGFLALMPVPYLSIMGQ